MRVLGRWGSAADKSRHQTDPREEDEQRLLRLEPVHKIWVTQQHSEADMTVHKHSVAAAP